MSIAPPRIDPAWPPQYPPMPTKQRRWPAVAAAAAGGAIVAGVITTVISLSVTAPAATSTTNSNATVTVTAEPPAPPAPLPVADADSQTCHAWGTTDTLYTAAATAQGVIPQGMTITDPAVQENPTWKAGVLRASDLYGQAANTLESQIAPGTSPVLTQVAATTVGSLRTLSEAYKAFDLTNSRAVSLYQANQKAMDWLCR
jgi:hypothetical protein